MRAAAATNSASSAQHAPPQVSSISAHVNSVRTTKGRLGEQGSAEIAVLPPDVFRNVHIPGAVVGFINVPLTPKIIEPPPPYYFVGMSSFESLNYTAIR